MFRVHQPAHSYFKKQAKTYGSGIFLKAYLESMDIRKSGLLHYRVGGENNRGFVHSWAPEDAINPDPNEPDHPPWSHNPQTGQLINNQDGTAFGHHPIDYVHKDLSEKYGPESATQIINNAIDRYNMKHPRDTNHGLPPFESPEWRKTFAGDYIDPKTPAEERQIRGDTPLYEGGPRPLVTYSMNMGNVDPETGADQGSWIDGGHIHFHKEIGEELAAAGVPPNEYKRLPYVKYSVLKPNYLTNDLVVSWNKTDAAKAGLSGTSPDNYLHPEVRSQLDSQRTHGDIHAHQVAHLLPDVFYHGATGSGGGRPKGGEEDPVSAGEQLASVMQQAGVSTEGYSPEELNQMAGTMAMKLFFSRTHNLEGSGGGAVKTAINNTFRELGSHHTDEEYKLHRSNAKAAVSTEGPSYHKTANIRAADIVGHLSNLAGKYMQQGMSEEQALEQAATNLRAHESQKSRYAPVEGLREKTEDLIGRIMGAQGHEKFNLGSVPTEHIAGGLPHGFGETHTEVPEHWQKRIVGTSDLAPASNARREMPVPQREKVAVGPLAPTPAPAPAAPMPQQVMPTPTAAAPAAYPTRPAAPFEEQYFGNRLGMDPRQQLWDIGSGALVQRSDDILVNLDEIRKKIELVQIMDARQDKDITKMIPNRALSIDSYWDVQDIAKSLGLTGVDVHGLYQSQGDWYKVADEWSVKPEIVKAVKVAFGGVF